MQLKSSFVTETSFSKLAKPNKLKISLKWKRFWWKRKRPQDFQFQVSNNLYD